SYDTTVGRVMLYDVVPKQLSFELVNKVMDKKALGNLIDSCYRQCGQKETVLLADHIRTTGYSYATKAGISICLDNMRIPEAKSRLIGKAQDEVLEIENQYVEG